MIFTQREYPGNYISKILMISGQAVQITSLYPFLIDLYTVPQHMAGEYKYYASLSLRVVQCRAPEENQNALTFSDLQN